jgi:hypothetical protein
VPNFVYDIPTIQLAILFSIVAVSAAVIGLVVVKPLLRVILGTGPEFNQSLSYGATGFNLFYGLLLGLLTVAAYQANERVQQAILAEATAVGSLYAGLRSYPEPTQSEVQALLRDYVLFTIYSDWDAHRQGRILDGGDNRADAIRQRLSAFEPVTNGQMALHTAMIGSFQDFSQARQQRLAGVITEIPNVLWYAVLVGALVNVILFVMLKMRFAQHLLLGTITSFFLGVILFVIVSLDDPMRGEQGLEPRPFLLLWERQMIWDEGPAWSLGQGGARWLSSRCARSRGCGRSASTSRTRRCARGAGALSNMTGRITFTRACRGWATSSGRSSRARRGSGRSTRGRARSSSSRRSAATTSSTCARGNAGSSNPASTGPRKPRCGWASRATPLREPLGGRRALRLEDDDHGAGEGRGERPGAGRDDRHPRRELPGSGAPRARPHGRAEVLLAPVGRTFPRNLISGQKRMRVYTGRAR